MRAFAVSVSPLQEDHATALLWELGTVGLEVRDAGAGAVELVAYFAETGPSAPEVLAALAPLDSARVEIRPVPEVDWVARFRAGFAPFPAGRFRIVPSWQPGPQGDERLIVEPGRAFGTGTHETTRLCLAALEALAGGGLGRVLDVGAGTGLLAVAATRLGARLVVAVDIDPEAIASARRHARLNLAPIHVVWGDGVGAFRPGSFDVALANLTTSLLIERRRGLSAVVVSGGTLVLSGMLAEDVPAVVSEYGRPGSAEILREGDWAALVLRGSSA